MTFDQGRVFHVFHGVAEDNALASGTRRIVTSGDLAVMEVAGKAAPFTVVVKNGGGEVLGSKSYDLPAFAATREPL